MLLFPQSKFSKGKSDERNFYVLSSRPQISEQLCEQLRMAGIESVENLHHDFLLNGLNIPSHASGLIIDIGANEQIEETIRAIQSQIPRQVWCCVVGDSDSISLAQAFSRHSIYYFNIQAQQENMVQAAVAGLELKVNRQAIVISVFGCKGGAGTSQLTFKLANEIARIKNMPTLYIQGALGSRDLDLLAGKKLTSEIMIGSKQLDYMASHNSSHIPDLGLADLQKYNFVVFEQSIITADKELQRELVENSQCVVLVVDRSMSSVRVARNMIENIQLMQRTHRASHRLYLCLNDTRPVSMNALSQSEIESLLERAIDVVFPYSKLGPGTSAQRPSLFSTVSPMSQLVSAILGGAVHKKTSLLEKLLSGNRKTR